MGILNRLWATPWRKEQAKKHVQASAYWHAKHNEITAEMKQMEEELTPVQREALKMGPVEGLTDPDYGSYLQNANMAAQQNAKNYLYQQAILQQKQIASNNGVFGAISQQHQHTSNVVGTSISGLAGSINSLTQAASSSVFGSLINGGAPVRWPTLGTGERDTFFMALKGIEEAAMKDPTGNSRYDQDAYDIQDLRSFNAQTINLLGIVSFCLANLVDPNGIVTLLEGHGMKLVLEE